MALVKTSISIPEDLLTEARATSKNLSSLVAEALREYLRNKKVERALSSFGSWQEREQDSVEIVREIRKTRRRNYAARSH